MTRSLRRTLAVRFAATMAVGLLGMSALLWWAGSRVLRSQLDQSLSAAAYLVAYELSLSPQCLEAPHALAANAVRFRREINRYVVFRDPHCRTLRAIPGWATDLPADSGAIARAAAGASSFSNARWHGMPMRSTYIAIAGDSTPSDRIVQVAASLEPIRELQWIILLALLGIVVVGIGAAYIGAGLLAGSAVRPVVEITDQATRVEAGTLDRRISAHADTVEYRDLVAVLNRMLERLLGAFRAQRRFTENVSHELRTPLTALRGEIEVALRADRSVREYQLVLRSGLEEIELLTMMTEELLLITRAEAGLITPQREPTDVNALVETSLERLRHRIVERELSVERDLARKDGEALVDRKLMVRLIDELLDNAVNHSEMGGRLTIRTERDQDQFRFVVEDTGPGIAPADLPHIFEAYYRADEARTRGAGTGLGLTTVAAIVRMHGGAIHATNRDDGGARFEVILPTTPFPN